MRALLINDKPKDKKMTIKNEFRRDKASIIQMIKLKEKRMIKRHNGFKAQLKPSHIA